MPQHHFFHFYVCKVSQQLLRFPGTFFELCQHILFFCEKEEISFPFMPTHPGPLPTSCNTAGHAFEVCADEGNAAFFLEDLRFL